MGSIVFVLCLGSLMLLNWRLLMKVARLRRQNRLDIGLKGEAMERASAAHRNFVENTPINLIAPSIVLLNGHAWLASIPMVLLLAGRRVSRPLGPALGRGQHRIRRSHSGDEADLCRQCGRDRVFGG